MPFGNSFLMSCKFLLPSRNIQKNEQLEKWVLTVARSLPVVISDDCPSSLKVEVRLHQIWLQERISESPSADISSQREAVEESGKFPLLVKVTNGVFIFPHVNAEVERTLSVSQCHSTYLEMMLEKQRLEKQQNTKDMEKNLRSEIENMKRKDKKLKKLDKNMENNENTVTEPLKEKE